MDEQEVRATAQRTNEQWRDGLRAPGRDEALTDLRATLVRGLGYALASRSDIDEASLEDFAQEALPSLRRSSSSPCACHRRSPSAQR